MGGILIRTPNPKNFRLRRAKKITFLGVLEQKIFRLRRANPMFFGFYECKKALLSFVNVSNLRAGAVPIVFTSVGTRGDYSQKYYPLYMRAAAFCEGRNARLLFAKCICCRTVTRCLIFTSVGTRVYHPQNVR